MKFKLQIQLWNDKWQDIGHDGNGGFILHDSKSEAEDELLDHVDSMINAGLQFEIDDYRIVEVNETTEGLADCFAQCEELSEVF